jgi:hypothetical protein
MESVFTSIYENNSWGNNNNPEYNGSSGSGSDVNYNKDSYVPFLKKFIIDNNIKNIVDLGCGDFRCGKLIYDDLDITYTGYDTYKKIIDYNSKQNSLPKYSFKHLDFYNNKETIINGELCILKDVLQHWPLDNIYNFLDYLNETKKFKFILICNCCGQFKDNPNVETGGWRPLSCDYLPLKRYNTTKMYNYDSKEVSIIKVNMDTPITNIPKIIFQTSKEKPEQYVIDKILSKCDHWKYIHYNDEEAIQFFRENYIEEFKDIIAKFNEIPNGAHKADLFRYYHLYVTGGVFIDSDAMIKMNIENIIKDYEFFSINSAYNPNTIFQGFIGSTPKNIIIYHALKDVYNINISDLSNYYHLLCRNLYNIIHNNEFNVKYHLYKEGFYNYECAKCMDDNNEIILLHFWKHKTIPRY